MTIDYSKLSLVNALDIAVLIEEEAKERYEEFATQMEIHHTTDAARFFGQMAKIEERHRTALLERRKKLFPDVPAQMRREMIFDVEAPGYDEARASMTHRAALEVSLRAEMKAHDFFAKALPKVTNAEVRALFEELKREEIEHQELVKKELAKLPPDQKFRAEDFEDEPVAH